MFDRYLDESKRAIFYARAEALSVNSPEIGTGHILLGLLREEKSDLERLLGLREHWDAFRSELGAKECCDKIANSANEIPLTNDSKKVLAYAAMEADSLRHAWIAPEHLLLALLREKSGPAFAMLTRAGLNVDGVRDKVRTNQRGWPLSKPPMPREQKIKILLVIVAAMALGGLAFLAWNGPSH
jgi:ATP-dependent Clp protease ATP-binding subunit ClpC